MPRLCSVNSVARDKRECCKTDMRETMCIIINVEDFLYIPAILDMIQGVLVLGEILDEITLFMNCVKTPLAFALMTSLLLFFVFCCCCCCCLFVLITWNGGIGLYIPFLRWFQCPRCIWYSVSLDLLLTNTLTFISSMCILNRKRFYCGGILGRQSTARAIQAFCKKN